MKDKIDDIALLQSVFESSVEGILVLDHQGTIMKVNPSSETIFGYKAGELIGKKIELLIPDEFKKAFKTHKEKHSKNLKNRFVINGELLFGLKKDGVKFSLDISLSPSNSNGKPVTIAFVRDSTKRILTNQNAEINKDDLTATEVRNKAILQAIPDIMFVNNKQDVYLDVHANDPSLLIVPKDEIIGKRMSDILPKDLYEKIMTAFANCKKTKEVQILKYSLPILDEIKYFEARIVVKDNGNFLTIIRDITDDKHNQIVLEESEERFRLAMLSTNDGFYDFNPETNMGWYNQKYIDLFNPTNEKFWWENNIHPVDKKRVLSTIDKILKSKDSFWTSEYKLKSNNTTYFDVEDRGYIVRDKNGKAIRVLGSVTDITERKKNEKKLKVSEQKLRNYNIKLEGKVQKRTKELKATVQQLVESNLTLEDQVQVIKKAEAELLNSQTLFSAIAKNFPKGIISVIDKDFKTLYSEGEGLDLIGLKDYPFVGKTIDEIAIFTEERRLRIKEEVKRTLTGEHLYNEIEINNIIFAINTTPLFDDNNKVTRALFVHTDISQQKKVEQGIQDALEKEHELNELKSRFIAMASHEFRTPLTAILSSAILIKKQNEAGKEVKREKYVSQIERNIKNLVTILNDFLSLSKLEEGKVEAKLEVFDIIDFSKNIIQEITPNLKTGQAIKLKNDQASINTFLDSKLMHHILTNLLSNAIKYSPENKDITLKISTKAAQLYIEVTDQGIGIPLEEQQNMFQRFYRAKNTTNIEGTGLGLNIIKQYTELMNGKVSLKSKLNEGSTFSVELPINQK